MERGGLVHQAGPADRYNLREEDRPRTHRQVAWRFERELDGCARRSWRGQKHPRELCRIQSRESLSRRPDPPARAGVDPAQGRAQGKHARKYHHQSLQHPRASGDQLQAVHSPGPSRQDDPVLRCVRRNGRPRALGGDSKQLPRAEARGRAQR